MIQTFKKVTAICLTVGMTFSLFTMPVAAAKVKKIKLNKTKISLDVRQTFKLNATVTPKKQSKKLNWKTSNSKIAAVKKGKVTAKSAGTATITAYIGKKKATCKVTVRKADNNTKTPVPSTNPTTGTSATPAPTGTGGINTTTNPTQPPERILSEEEKQLVGIWVDTPFKQDIDLNNYGLGSWMEFKSDGTYRHYWHHRRNIGIGTLTEGGIITESGRYSIEGGKIRVTNRLQSHNKSTYVADSFFGEEYNNKPIADGLLPFVYEESFYYGLEDYVVTGVDKFSGFPGLAIDMYPDTDNGYVAFIYGRQIKLNEIKGILRWPGGLPDYLYPAGYNGIVSCTTPTNVSTLDIEKRLIDRSKGPHYDTVFIVEIPGTKMDDINPYLEKLTANGFMYDMYQYKKVLEIHGAKYEVIIRPYMNPIYNHVLYPIYGLTGEYVKIDFCFTLVQ